MVLSELTNKELKGILRENDVRNYSKLNKKGLLKKVNQLIKAQNGGGKKNGKGKNKKYTFKDLIGGKPINSPLQGATSQSATPQGDTPQGSAPQSVTPQGANAASKGANSSVSDSSPISTNGPSAPPLDPSENSSEALQQNNPLSNEQRQILKNNKYMQLKQKNNAAREKGETPVPRLARNAIIENYEEQPIITPSDANVKSNKTKECGPCSIQ
jgi:hypothetical protein